MEAIDLIGRLVSQENKPTCVHNHRICPLAFHRGMDIIFIYLHKGRLSPLDFASDRNRTAGLYFIHPLLNSGSISRKCLYHGHPVLVLSLLCLFCLGSGSFLFPFRVSSASLYVVGIPISLCSATHTHTHTHRSPPFPSSSSREHLPRSLLTFLLSSSRRPPGALGSL